VFLHNVSNITDKLDVMMAVMTYLVEQLWLPSRSVALLRVVTRLSKLRFQRAPSPLALRCYRVL
jgi:hypothetical protein